jgi:hypothetical protein
MQRGILNLTKKEAELSYRLLENSAQNISSFRQRLQLVLKGSEELTKIEVSRDDVEALLDALPIPTDPANPTYQVLRNKLSMFLAKKNE